MEGTAGSRETSTDIEKEMRDRLTRLQYHVMRESGTERPFSGEYLHTDEKGTYRCAACGHELFSSEAKFDSHCGWPAFDAPMTDESVTEMEDRSHGMVRVEVRCPNCDSHLGHVFNDGPTSTGIRYCINSCALDLQREESK